MENKDKVFSLRLSKKEYEYIQEQAKLNHLSVGQYIRMTVLKGVKL